MGKNNTLLKIISIAILVGSILVNLIGTWFVRAQEVKHLQEDTKVVTKLSRLNKERVQALEIKQDFISEKVKSIDAKQDLILAELRKINGPLN